MSLLSGGRNCVQLTLMLPPHIPHEVLRPGRRHEPTRTEFDPLRQGGSLPFLAEEKSG